MPSVAHLGVLRASCRCGSSFQSEGISNCSAGMLAVSMEVVSVVSDTTRMSAPAAGGGAGAACEEDCALKELAAALAAGSAVAFAAPAAAAPPAESAWIAEAP